MQVVITIRCDNAAFGETECECGEELYRILDLLGQQLAEEGTTAMNGHPIRDMNGNTVGRIVLEPSPKA